MLIAFHKPFGVLSQFTPELAGQRTLAEFGFPEGVYPLGRLDADSEGLLLLSEEKDLNARLLKPETQHPRTYWVQVEGIPSAPALDQLRRGVALNAFRSLPAKVQVIADPPVPPRIPPIRFRKTVPTSWLEIILIEGKNRQVRRMTAKVGYPTLRLIRVAIGGLELADLPPSQWRLLDTRERALVFRRDWFFRD